MLNKIEHLFIYRLVVDCLLIFFLQRLYRDYQCRCCGNIDIHVAFKDTEDGYHYYHCSCCLMEFISNCNICNSKNMISYMWLEPFPHFHLVCLNCHQKYTNLTYKIETLRELRFINTHYIPTCECQPGYPHSA